MGAVSIDVYRKEKEYRHLTLSDKTVVKYLIEFRSQLDVSYGANTNINIHVAGDTMDFNVELIALFASLDHILERVELKEKDRIFAGLLFEGHNIGDIIKHYGYARKTAYRTLDRIVEKVAEQNRQDWIACKQKQGYIEQDTEKEPDE